MCPTDQVKAQVEKKMEESLKSYLCLWNRYPWKGRYLEYDFRLLDFPAVDLVVSYIRKLCSHSVLLLCNFFVPYFIGP